jgi:hypothetical protein
MSGDGENVLGMRRWPPDGGDVLEVFGVRASWPEALERLRCRQVCTGDVVRR